MQCQKCGNEIPIDSEFCQKCGTKVEHETRKKSKYKNIAIISSLIAILSIVASVGLFIYENEIIQSKDDELEELKESYNNLDEKYTSKTKELDTLQTKYDEMKDVNWDVYSKAAALDNYIVFVGTDEYYYHKYECSHLDMTEFWAFNKEAVIGRYYPCPYCID